MKSELPKVLHDLGGKTLIERVLDSVATVPVERCLAIVGHRAEWVQERLGDRPVVSVAGSTPLEFVVQAEQLGTGHAAQQLLDPLANFTGDVLILNGDVPLLRPETIAQLLATHQQAGNAATILTARFPDPTGYGRVFCDDRQQVQEIIEHRDCTPEQRQCDRINAGIYCFRWSALAARLPLLSADNDQNEYYLTDVIRELDPVMAVDVADLEEIMGINDRKQLADAYQVVQRRIKERWMRSGVTLIDPGSITIDDTVEIAPDATIEPQTHLRGQTTIAAGARIGPGSLLENAQIGADATVLYATVTDSVVGAGTRVGPYAHLRGAAQTGDRCRIGNFVELKNTTLGDATNVSHLSYLGDATVGTRTNIGAGTITANYDGVKKHRTTLGDRVKTGSNSVLVAPITLGNDVTVAAGSVLTEDVPADCLAIARSRQTLKPGWRLPPSS